MESHLLMRNSSKEGLGRRTASYVEQSAPKRGVDGARVMKVNKEEK